MNLIDTPEKLSLPPPIRNPNLYIYMEEYEKAFTPSIGSHTIMFFPGPDVIFERWPRSVSNLEAAFTERWGY